MQDLDGILDRDDVLVHAMVDVIDHGGQSSGLAGARCPGDQHQSARLKSQLLNDRGKH